MDSNGHTGLHAYKTDCSVLPVNVVALQIGDVALARAQMPAQLIKHLPLGVRLGRDDFLMLLKRDGALFFEPNRRPLAFGDDGAGKPVHVEGEILNASQKHVR